MERLFGDPRQEFESNDGPGWGHIVDRPLRMDTRELRGRLVAVLLAVYLETSRDMECWALL